MQDYYKRDLALVVAIFGLSYALDFQLQLIHRKMWLLTNAKAFSVVIHVVFLVSASKIEDVKNKIIIFSMDQSFGNVRDSLTHIFTCILYEISPPSHLISFQKLERNGFNFVWLLCRSQLFLTKKATFS